MIIIAIKYKPMNKRYFIKGMLSIFGIAASNKAKAITKNVEDSFVKAMAPLATFSATSTPSVTITPSSSRTPSISLSVTPTSSISASVSTHLL